MATKLNFAEKVKTIPKEEILKRRIKRLVQECFENPELNFHIITMFLNRDIKWNTINKYLLHGKPIKCQLCKENSITGLWCNPCIHPNWCCYCCILLGFFRYS